MNWRLNYVNHPRARPMGADLVLAARRQDGSEFPVDVSLSPLTTDDGLLVLAAVRDVTDRKRFEQELARQALHDPLTGLPNRQLLIDRLDVALARQVRDGGDTGVLYADLDHFKWVNDSLGHDRGDVLLIQVADRLTAAVRGTDTVSRFGGDEFVIVLDAISSPEEAELVAQRCAEAVARPMTLDDTEINQMVSIGVTTCRSGQQCLRTRWCAKPTKLCIRPSNTDGRTMRLSARWLARRSLTPSKRRSGSAVRSPTVSSFSTTNRRSTSSASTLSR